MQNIFRKYFLKYFCKIILCNIHDICKLCEILYNTRNTIMPVFPAFHHFHHIPNTPQYCTLCFVQHPFAAWDGARRVCQHCHQKLAAVWVMTQWWLLISEPRAAAVAATAAAMSRVRRSVTAWASGLARAGGSCGNWHSRMFCDSSVDFLRLDRGQPLQRLSDKERLRETLREK